MTDGGKIFPVRRPAFFAGRPLGIFVGTPRCFSHKRGFDEEGFRLAFLEIGEDRDATGTECQQTQAGSGASSGEST
jgi:hypothetical protein